MKASDKEMCHRSPLTVRRSGLLGIILLLGLLGSITSPVGAQTSQAVDETAIKKQLAAYAEARSGGNGREQALFYTEDADEWGGKRQMSKGRADLERDLALTPIPGNTFRLEVSSLSFLSVDVALVDTLYYYGPRAAPGDPIGHVFYLMVRRNATWLIRSARVTAWRTNR